MQRACADGAVHVCTHTCISEHQAACTASPATQCPKQRSLSTLTQVEYDNSLITAEKLARAVDDAGFEATILSAEPVQAALEVRGHNDP